MNDAKRAKIEVALGIAEDFSDGTFWAFMAEQGIDADDLAAYEAEKAKKKKGAKKRR